MTTQTKTIGDYRAPKCKVVEIHVQNLVCASYGEQGAAGGKVTVDFDDENY